MKIFLPDQIFQKKNMVWRKVGGRVESLVLTLIFRTEASSSLGENICIKIKSLILIPTRIHQTLFSQVNFHSYRQPSYMEMQICFDGKSSKLSF